MAGAGGSLHTMWKRLRRRSMAPSRPAVFPEQVGLVLVSVGAVVAGIVLLVYLFAA
jgi:hypothetical protein